MWDTYNDAKVQIWMEYKAMERMKEKVQKEIKEGNIEEKDE